MECVERKNGSCGMVVILERMYSRGNVEMSMPSIEILPDFRSRRRRRVSVSEDFPLVTS